MDESGTRHPDHNPKRAAHNHDYFALGGVLIKEDEESIARQIHLDFCQRWEITTPLHSSEIRGRHEKFTWIGKLDKEKQELFYEELYQILKNSPVIGIACVIDRPGYNNRYREKYGNQPWLLCKTAFNILIERAAKYAESQGYKLRVLPEKCNKNDDRTLREYYNKLKSEGMPFDKLTSSRYLPLQGNDFQRILYEFQLKEKSSPMIQLADIYLWIMAIGGYDKNNRAYKRLIEDRKLIDCLYNQEEIAHLGIKYSCFDLVNK